LAQAERRGIAGVRLAAEVRRGLKLLMPPPPASPVRVRLAAEVRRGLKPGHDEYSAAASSVRLAAEVRRGLKRISTVACTAACMFASLLK